MKTRSLSRRDASRIEVLEARIAPAAVFTYTDVDGDFVTVKTSKGTDGQLAAIITLAPLGVGMELRRIDFSANPAVFANTNLSVSARHTSVGGDGMVNFGYIDATAADGGAALDLGLVTIKGDLGQINAGDATTATAAVKGLSVQSIGRFGTTTQAPGGDLRSDLSGALGFLKVAGDVKDAFVFVSGIGDGKIGFVTIGGSLIGGAADDSGRIRSAGPMGPVKIGGDIEGGSGARSGQIFTNSTLGSVTVRGSLFGGSSASSGSIVSVESMGAVKIGGNVEGGSGEDSGEIVTNGPIASVAIGGSLIGGSNNFSGRIFGGGAMGAVKIGGNIEGGDVSAAVTLFDTGVIETKRIARLIVGGSIISGAESGGGTLVNSGAVRVFDDLGPVTIKGSLIGNSSVPVFITARGQATPSAGADIAIRSLTVGGRAEFAYVFAGYDTSDTPVGQNADAQIGKVVIGRDWIASNLVAGVQDDLDSQWDDFFGEGDDMKIIGGTDTAARVSKIASVLIKRQALGVNFPGAGFGFVAQQIGSFKVGGTAFPLTAGPANDLAGLSVGVTGDLRVREVTL